MSLKTWKRWIVVLALAPLLAVACGGGDEEPTADASSHGDDGARSRADNPNADGEARRDHG